MANQAKLSHSAAIILRCIDRGYRYGFEIMEASGLPSGTVYPALRRLERDELIAARWESERIASAEQRPARRYYRTTKAGNEVLAVMLERYPLLQKLELAQQRE